MSDAIRGCAATNVGWSGSMAKGAVVVATMTRVLVVDDHADAREVLGMLLATQGYEVQTAENGLHALAALETRPR